MKAITEAKSGSTRERWERVGTDDALKDLWAVVIVDTRAESLFRAMQEGTVPTNVYLRRVHNFCVDMNWLAWPLILKRQWPEVRYKEKRAITWEEHCRIVDREKNEERRAFYQLAWHLGASQTDIATLDAADIDWTAKVVSYSGKKTGVVALVHFGSAVEAILGDLPKTGPLIPYLRQVWAGDRATEFKQRCEGLKIYGITLHLYRYAWAERALKCGYPERFAQEALGYSSKAVHRAYEKRARVTKATRTIPRVYESLMLCGRGQIVGLRRNLPLAEKIKPSQAPGGDPQESPRRKMCQNHYRTIGKVRLNEYEEVY